MLDLSRVGANWIIDEVNGMTDNVKHITPTAFNEENRYLPESVTSIPGYIRYDVNPFMREIVDCFDIDSPVREVNLKKGWFNGRCRSRRKVKSVMGQTWRDSSCAFRSFCDSALEAI